MTNGAQICDIRAIRDNDTICINIKKKDDWVVLNTGCPNTPDIEIIIPQNDNL